MPKYGTVALKNDYNILLKSKSLLAGISAYRTIYSSTGAVIDTENALIGDYMAIDDLSFSLNFEEEI